MSALCKIVRDCATQVFAMLGRGHSESIYANALYYVLCAHPYCSVSREVVLPVTCIINGMEHQVGALRADLVVETRHAKIDTNTPHEEIVVELKAVNGLTDNHTNQVLCYMNCKEQCTGALLLNFGQQDMLLKESVAFKINQSEVLKSEARHTPYVVDWLFFNKV